MEIKGILACVDASEYSMTVMHLSTYIAEKIKAKVCGLHVIDILQLEGPLMYDISGALGFEPFANFSLKIKAVLEEKGRVVLNAFEEIAKQKGVAFERFMDIGIITKTILEYEKRCDLVAIGRKGVNEQYDRGILGTNIESILRKTNKPLLVAPRQFYPFANVVACVDSREPSKKVYDYARYVSQVFGIPLKAVYVDNKKKDEDLSYFDKIDIITSKSVTDGLEEYIRKVENPLVCIGAYAKPKLIEIVLGSTTENLLKRDIEVHFLVVR